MNTFKKIRPISWIRYPPSVEQFAQVQIWCRSHLAKRGMYKLHRASAIHRLGQALWRRLCKRRVDQSPKTQAPLNFKTLHRE
jgi:hypothetical protein